MTELPDFDNWFIITGLLAYIVICFNLFIALLPEKKDNINLPNIQGTCSLCRSSYLYSFACCAICISGKNFDNHGYASGTDKYIRIFSITFFIFFYLNLGSYENRAVSFLKVWRLVSATNNRITGSSYLHRVLTGLQLQDGYQYYSSYSSWFIIISLIKGKFVKHVITGFAVIILLSSIGPLNVMDIPIYEQSHRLEKVLEANGMFFDGKITPKSDLTKEDMRIISSCYDYLKYTDNPPAYLDNDLAFYSLFGFEQLNSYGEPDPYNMIHLNKYVQ